MLPNEVHLVHEVVDWSLEDVAGVLGAGTLDLLAHVDDQFDVPPTLLNVVVLVDEESHVGPSSSARVARDDTVHLLSDVGEVSSYAVNFLLPL